MNVTGRAMVSELASQSPLPELVRDAKLQATIENSLTTHTRRSGHRAISRHESWAHERLLGHGGNGVVWLERKVKDDDGPAELRAVKGIQTSNHQSKTDSMKYVRELEALAKFSQKKYADFFVGFYGWYESPGWLYVATEYCEYGDLSKYLACVKTLPEDQAHGIASQILGALTLMHEEGFAHRDLKPANILIKRKPPKHWWIKLCDFGLCKRSEYIMGLTTVQGTPAFMPPETIGHPFRGDPKTANPFYVDMWCLGEIIHQTLIGHATFKERGNLQDFHLGLIPFPEHALQRAGTSGEAIDFIRLLMLPTPWQRLNTKKAWRHPWMEVEAKPAGRVAAPAPTRSPPDGLNPWSAIPTTDDQLTQASGQFNVTTTQQRPMAGGHLYQTPSGVSQMLPSYAAPTQSDLTLPSAQWSTASMPGEAPSLNSPVQRIDGASQPDVAQINDVDAQNGAQSDQKRPAGASPQRPGQHLQTTSEAAPVSPSNSNSGGNSYHSVSMYGNKAVLKIQGKLGSMAENWSQEEWDNRRRIVRFQKNQRGSTLTASFQPVSVIERPPNSICISCIWWAEKTECYVTSVDIIHLLEQLVAAPNRFSVEEKNRIRSNLEGFHPLTVSKAKPESEEFFKIIMAFPNPKPRIIEKDVRVFPWKILESALKKIVGKYALKA
ncbi:hypothetical protein AUP68_11581 [Ilyonectria robusta]